MAQKFLIFAIAGSAIAAEPPIKTKTAILKEADATCESGIKELCIELYCPTYCKDKYANWHHSGNMMQKECLARCTTDLCTLKSRPDSFDTPLDEQIREQTKVCMKEVSTPQDHAKMHEPHTQMHKKWPDFRIQSFSAIEKKVKDKHEALEKKQQEEDMKKKKQEEQKP